MNSANWIPAAIGLGKHLITLCASLKSAHKHAEFFSYIFLMQEPSTLV